MHSGLQSRILLRGVFCLVIAVTVCRAQNPETIVFVFSDVPVPASILSVAEQRASQIFLKAGIEIEWINCRFGSDPACNRTFGPRDVSLRITPRVSNATSDVAFGVAWLDRNGAGRYADIFWKRVEHLTEQTNINQGLILGSVMAHEMGHLLGVKSHSVKGLMSPRWGTAELQAIQMGTLLFLPGQDKQMRVSSRSIIDPGETGTVPDRVTSFLARDEQFRACRYHACPFLSHYP